MSTFRFSDITLDMLAEASMRLTQIVKRYDMLSERWHPERRQFAHAKALLSKARINQDPGLIMDVMDLLTKLLGPAFPLIWPDAPKSLYTRYADLLRTMLVEEGAEEYTDRSKMLSDPADPSGHTRSPASKRARDKFEKLQRFSLAVKDDVRELLKKLRIVYSGAHLGRNSEGEE